jgi:hypothetical protein
VEEEDDEEEEMLRFFRFVFHCLRIIVVIIVGAIQLMRLYRQTTATASSALEGLSMLARRSFYHPLERSCSMLCGGGGTVESLGEAQSAALAGTQINGLSIWLCIKIFHSSSSPPLPAGASSRNSFPLSSGNKLNKEMKSSSSLSAQITQKVNKQASQNSKREKRSERRKKKAKAIRFISPGEWKVEKGRMEIYLKKFRRKAPLVGNLFL